MPYVTINIPGHTKSTLPSQAFRFHELFPRGQSTDDVVCSTPIRLTYSQTMLKLGLLGFVFSVWCMADTLPRNLTTHPETLTTIQQVVDEHREGGHPKIRGHHPLPKAPDPGPPSTWKMDGTIMATLSMLPEQYASPPGPRNE
jgi:hypothetical protein